MRLNHVNPSLSTAKSDEPGWTNQFPSFRCVTPNSNNWKNPLKKKNNKQRIITLPWWQILSSHSSIIIVHYDWLSLLVDCDDITRGGPLPLVGPRMGDRASSCCVPSRTGKKKKTDAH
ncbi:hypothetical protein NPIL_647691 [Nephila pilipes]|uniref:Uncharacterized protein n=1 Tax=Nephila pilipes TaxID=299642 RepID=A0A8X6P3W5_NEPPI|nr:hypothetical protein NPIL_647691 [Nephila pilipes]